MLTKSISINNIYEGLVISGLYYYSYQTWLHYHNTISTASASVFKRKDAPQWKYPTTWKSNKTEWEMNATNNIHGLEEI